MPDKPHDLYKLRDTDLPGLKSLLRNNHLPDDDCDQQAQNFRAFYDGDELIAAGGLEPAGDFVLLRSVVIREDQRGQGLGRQMTEQLLQQARKEGRVAVYLLTETAADYFRALGFQSVERSGVPTEIQRTRQFASLCPDSASCLYLPLARS